MWPTSAKKFAQASKDKDTADKVYAKSDAVPLFGNWSFISGRALEAEREGGEGELLPFE